MDAHNLIYGRVAHDKMWVWLSCGYSVQQYLYWNHGVKSCPDWEPIGGLK